MSDVGEWSKDLHHDKYVRAVGSSKRKRKSRMIEKRLVSDFCAKYLKDYRVFLRLRLGDFYAGQLRAGLSFEERNMLGNWRYYADAVGIGDKDIVLVECAVRFRADHVGKLLGYSYLLPRTPEISPFLDHELRLLAVSPQFDGLALLMLKRFDIEVWHFRPSYVEAYFRTLEKRKQRSSLTLLPSMARYGDKNVKGYRI